MIEAAGMCCFDVRRDRGDGGEISVDGRERGGESGERVQAGTWVTKLSGDMGDIEAELFSAAVFVPDEAIERQHPTDTSTRELARVPRVEDAEGERSEVDAPPVVG